MEEVLKEVARALFEQDTGATRSDISWRGVSAAVSNEYRVRAMTLLTRVKFKAESLYAFLEKQL